MCQGRCPGCGLTGPHRAITEHAVSCAEVAALAARHIPFLDPAAEYERYQAEHADADKATARQEQVERTDAARAAMAERFRTKDPLEG